MDWNAIGVMVSNGILLASLVVISFQMREMSKQTLAGTRATRAAVYQAICEVCLDIDRMFIEHPEMRAYFYDNKPLPRRRDERARLLAAAELVVDVIDNVVVQRPEMSETLAAPWEAWFADMVRSSPAIREFWSTSSDWYGTTTRGIIDGALATSPTS